MSHARLLLWRTTDVSGVSGTGKVAEGVRFSDGTVVLRWLGDVKSTTVYANLQEAIRIHEHGGASCIYVVGDAYQRGIQDGAQDRCEGVTDLLGHRAAGTPQKPDWIVAADWRPYLKGYETQFRSMWGRSAPWEEE